MKESPEITRLAIRIANLVADTREANERCRQAAIQHELPPTTYAHLLLEVAKLRSQLDLPRGRQARPPRGQLA